jgi:hypothetical protein
VLREKTHELFRPDVAKLTSSKRKSENTRESPTSFIQ